MNGAPRPTSPTTPDLSDGALAAITARLAATAAEHDRSGELPRAALEAVHRAGLLTATVAQRYGGAGLGPVETARILLALGEGDASVALLAANTLAAHRAQALRPRWPEARYAELLERSGRGPALVNTIRAEPELGAPARGGLPATVVRRRGDGWSLSGRKAYGTGGEGLAVHLVWAVVDEPGGDPAAPRVVHAIVPGDAPGITWSRSWDHLGLRASNTHDVEYREVPLPSDALIEIPRGADGVYRDPAAQAGIDGLGHPAIYLGVARAARRAFVDFARERVPSTLGRPIAETERIRTVAGEIEAQIAQGETLLFGALHRLRAGDEGHLQQASVLKVQIVRSAIAAVQAAVAALGNPGLSRHLPLERLLRDVLCARVHPPQEDAALLDAGRRILAAS